MNDAKIITKKITTLLTHEIPNLRAARLAQLVEHQTFNLRAMGSSPISGSRRLHYHFRGFCKFNKLFGKDNTLGSRFLRDSVPAEIAQMGERHTEDLKVPGSIPGFGKTTFLNYFSLF